VVLRCQCENVVNIRSTGRNLSFQEILARSHNLFGGGTDSNVSAPLGAQLVLRCESKISARTLWTPFECFNVSVQLDPIPHQRNARRGRSIGSCCIGTMSNRKEPYDGTSQRCERFGMPWEEQYGYARAVKVDGTIYVSGQLSHDD
jgi:hypothetical protein